MGSPFKTCELELKGIKIDLPKYGWQDKYAWSSNKKYLVLIKWNTDNNEPGFNFYIINTETNSMKISNRKKGMVNRIEIQDQKIHYNKFLFDREKSKNGNQCCDFDEYYKIDK